MYQPIPYSTNTNAASIQCHLTAEGGYFETEVISADDNAPRALTNRNVFYLLIRFGIDHRYRIGAAVRDAAGSDEKRC